jgi:phenylalanyl-tRNA synthetase beta subunit
MVALELIDLYEAPEVGDRKKSLTYRLTLQSNYRNLRDDEVDRLIEVVLEDIRKEIGGELRSS